MDGAGAAGPAGAPGGWTFRRIPGRVARLLAVAAAAAVGFFVLHVGGWGLLDRLGRSLVVSGFAVGLPVALFLAFMLGAPLLRRTLRAGRLERARVIAVGAGLYGGVAFLWMAALRPGPPEALRALVLAGDVAGGPGWDALVAVYRHALTPAAFAAYGAAAAALGWRAAFGRRASAPAADGAPLDPDPRGAP